MPWKCYKAYTNALQGEFQPISLLYNDGSKHASYQQTNPSSKQKIETLEKGVKYVQS